MRRGERAGEGDAASSSARSDGVKMHNVTECVLLCGCSLKGEDREARGSWWNDYIVAERGGEGGAVEQLAETIIV